MCRPLNNEEGALERLSIQMPISNQQTVTISNWYLPPENSHFLQRIGFSMFVFQPEIQDNEIFCADLNAHNEIWEKHAHFEDSGAATVLYNILNAFFIGLECNILIFPIYQ